MSKIRRCKYPLFVITFLLILAISRTHYALAAVPEKNIIVLHQYSVDTPYNIEFNEGLIKTLNEENEYVFNFYFEYFEMDKFPNNDVYLQSIIEQLKIKKELSNWTPDVVISSGGLFDFLQENRSELFGEVPFVLIPRRYEKHSEKLSELYSKDVIIRSKEDYGKNFKLILDTQSDVKKIYVVIGASDNEQNIVEDIKAEAESYSNQVEFIYLNKMSYSDMIDTLKSASDDSVILFVRWLNDVEGKAFVPVRVLNAISKVANVPIYGTQRQFLGEGIVGGYLYDLYQVSKEAAKATISIIEGGNLKSYISTENAYNEFVFDERYLERWDIDLEKLPLGSRIEFKEDSLWDTYGVYIILAALVIILQLVLIVGLVSNYRKRMMAEEELYIMNESLETQVSVRTQELENAKARLEDVNKELELLSRLDPLTKLYNRKHMNERLNEAKSLFVRSGQIFTVMMLDIDDFKKINDSYGHAIGDEILKMVSSCLVENFRKHDVVARWGGEEFLILCSMLNEENSRLCAEQIRKKIEELIYHHDDIDLSVTVTIGVSTIRDGETVDEMVNRADKALYRGKKEGKNKVVF